MSFSDEKLGRGLAPAPRFILEAAGAEFGSPTFSGKNHCTSSFWFLALFICLFSIILRCGNTH